MVESAIKEFERIAANEPVLGHLEMNATNLLDTFKANIHSIYEYPLKCDIFNFDEFSNKIYKIKLYDGNIIAVTLHIFPKGFEKNLKYHNHSKHMMLQNFCGEYIHTIWRINSSKSGKLYKFSYKRDEINDSIDAVDSVTK